jgi:chaperonin cofactor prefoldin
MEIEEKIEKIVLTMNTLVNTVDEMESRIDRLETIIQNLTKKSE